MDLPVPLTEAYAHGDCDHPRPLFDALEQGFCNVEADVWLCDGEILVAHDLCNVRPELTFEAVYLEPLAQRARENGGFVFAREVEFVLLVDLKNEPEAMYLKLRDLLEPYRDVLTEYEASEVVGRGIRILLSGERPIQTVSRETHRLVFLDGRLPDLQHPIDFKLMPWVSDNWEEYFEWRGCEEISTPESLRLRQLVSIVKPQGVRLRLWSVPDRPEGWSLLRKHGVDLISTDRLESLGAFLRETE